MEELVEYTRHIIEKDPDRLDQLSDELMFSGVMTSISDGEKLVHPIEAQPTPRFAAWLTLYGKKPAK